MLALYINVVGISGGAVGLQETDSLYFTSYTEITKHFLHSQTSDLLTKECSQERDTSTTYTYSTWL